MGDLTGITSIQTRDLDWTPAGDDVEINLDQNNNVTACFAKGTMIRTAHGARAIETLRHGTLVWTLDAGLVALRRLHKIGAEGPPVVVQRGAMGAGLPAQRLVVSRQHRMLLQSRIAERMFGADEVLVPAHRLTGWPGIHVWRKDVVFYHLTFASHHVVCANESLSESRLKPNRHAPARMIIERPDDVDELLRRHRKNRKLLCGVRPPARVPLT